MSGARLTVTNYRGRRVPAVLGLVLAGALAVGVVPAFAVRPAAPGATAGWVTLLATLLVSATGLVDDLLPYGPRGLRGHLRALADGHLTTGALKLVVAAGAAIVLVRALRARPVAVELIGVVAIAACTNLWNGLDVRPGRALKAFLPIGFSAFALTEPWRQEVIVEVLLVGGALLAWFDLRERAMLGDCGSNLLGFAAGTWLYVVLPDAGVVALAAAAIALNLLADTFTLSRAIEALPPLRWFDRLGRLPAPR